MVTEYGTAQLKGKSTWQRAEALIDIAHPDFRDELIREADAMKIWLRATKREHDQNTGEHRHGRIRKQSV